MALHFYSKESSSLSPGGKRRRLLQQQTRKASTAAAAKLAGVATQALCVCCGEHRAAVALQRAWKKRTKNTLDPLTQEAPPPPGHQKRFVLVEPHKQVSYAFSADTFAASALCSGVFEHPVLRRPLVAPEITRLGRAAGLGAFGRGALRVAWEYRQLAAQHVVAQQSLRTFLEDEAGTALTAALDSGEINMTAVNIDDDYVSLREYESCLSSISLREPSLMEEVARCHMALILQRHNVWRETQEMLIDIIQESRSEANFCLRRQALKGWREPRTALGSLLVRQRKARVPP